MSRTSVSFLPMLLMLGAGISACGPASSGAAPSPSPAPTAGDIGLEAIISSTDLAVGRNRFTFGIINNNHPLNSGTPQVVFYDLNGPKPIRGSATKARFNYFARYLRDTSENAAALEIQGVYVAYPYFNRPGKWGAEFHVQVGGRVHILRDVFFVRRFSITPAVGSPAPRSNNPTIYQEPVTKLDSGRPPDDMHKLSIAEAIAERKPLVVLFATAAYCTSRMCGPEIQVVERLERRYRGRVNFVHIEIYQNANPQYGYAPTVLQWHLQTEPWVFVVNRRGIIVAKFEGPSTAAEIGAAIQAALRS